LHLPPLRDRTADIAPLAEYFARKYAAANGLPERKLSSGALEALRAHAWRGNVRELENSMHRAVLLAHGNIIDEEAIMLSGAPATVERASASPYASSTAQTGGDASSAVPASGGVNSFVGRTVADVERDLILDTLNHCLGNRTHAANILGISIRTLRNKLKQYSDAGMSLPPPPAGSAAGEEGGRV